MLTRALLCCAAMALAGCDVTDPYTKEGVWKPTGANEVNLRAMLVSPSDLVIGVAGPRTDGQQAAAALDRSRNDKVRPLPDSAIAKVVPISGGNRSQ